MPPNNRRKRRASCLADGHRVIQAAPVASSAPSAPTYATGSETIPTAAPATPSVTAMMPTARQQADPIPSPVEQQPQRGIISWISGLITPVYSFLCRRSNSAATETVTPTAETGPRVKRRKFEDATFTVAWASIASTRIGTQHVENILEYIKYIKARAEKPYVTIARYNFPGSIEAFSGERAYDRAFEISEKLPVHLYGYEAADAILPEVFKPFTELLKPHDIIYGDYPDTDHVLSADIHDWMIHNHKENTSENFKSSKTEFTARLDQAVKSIMLIYSDASFEKLKGDADHPLESYDVNNKERHKHGVAADLFEFLGRKMEKSRILRELVKVPAETLFSVAADCRALEEAKPVPSHVVIEPLPDRRDATGGVPHSFGNSSGQPQSLTIHMPADRMASFDENPTVALRDKYLRDHRRTFAPSPLVPLNLLPHPHRRALRPPLDVNRPLCLGPLLPNSESGRLNVNWPLNPNQPPSLHRPLLNLPRRQLDLHEQLRAHSTPPHINPLRRLEIRRPHGGRRPGILKRVGPPSFGPPSRHHNQRLEGRARHYLEEEQPLEHRAQFQEIDFFTGQPIATARPTTRTSGTPRPVIQRPNTPRPADLSTATDFNWAGHFAVPEDTDSESDDDSEPSVVPTPTRAGRAVASAFPPAQIVQGEQPASNLTGHFSVPTSTGQSSALPVQVVQEEPPAFNWAGHFAVPDDSDDESIDPIEVDEPEATEAIEVYEPKPVEAHKPEIIEVSQPKIEEHHQITSPTTPQTNVVGEPLVRYAEEVVVQSHATLPPVVTNSSPVMDSTNTSISPMQQPPSLQMRQNAATIPPRNASSAAAAPHRNMPDINEPRKASMSDSSGRTHSSSLASDLTTRKSIKTKSRYISSLGLGTPSKLIVATSTPRPAKRKASSAIRAALNAKTSPMPGSFPENNMEIDENETTESPQRPPFRQPSLATTDSHTTSSTVYFDASDCEKKLKDERASQSPLSDSIALTAEQRRQDLLDFFERDFSREMDPNGFFLESDLSSPAPSPSKADAGKAQHSSSRSDSSSSASSSASSSRSVSPVRQSTESELQPSFGRLKISNFKNHQLALEAQIEEELEQQAVREEKERLAREAEEERRRREAEEAERRRQEEQAVLERTGGLRPPRAVLIGGIAREWQQKIMVTFQVRDNQVLGKSGEGNDITAHSFKTVVHPTNWLDDEIINGSLSHLARFINEKAGIKDVRAQTPKCVLLNSHFYSGLTSSRGIRGTERWMRRLGVRQDNFLNVETFVIPVNLGNNHWTLAIVRPGKGEVAHIDSLRSSGAGRTVVANLLMDWVRAFLGDRYDERHWKTRNFVSPVQTNGHDCGVHTITTGMCIALGIDPSSYKASDMPLQRLRIAGALMNNGFHGDFDLSKL